MAKTKLGRWAVWLSLASVLLLAVLLVAYNTELLTLLARDPGRWILGLVTTVAALGTLVTGALAWLKLKDRSVLVIVATVFGLLATALLSMGWFPQD